MSNAPLRRRRRERRPPTSSWNVIGWIVVGMCLGGLFIFACVVLVTALLTVF